MSHADEVRALLLECAKTLDHANQTMRGPGAAGLEVDYLDGLTTRCRRYAEDLARPPSVSKWELGGEPLPKPPIGPSKICDVCHMTANHFLRTSPGKWTSLCTDCFARSPVPALRVTGIDATHDAAGEAHLENMDQICAGPATSVRAIANAVRYLLEKERSRDA